MSIGGAGRSRPVLTNTIDRPSGSQSGQFTVFGSARNNSSLVPVVNLNRRMVRHGRHGPCDSPQATGHGCPRARSVSHPPAASLSIRPRVSPFFLPATSLLLLNRGCRPPRFRGRNQTADLYSIFDLRPGNGDMEPVSNRNCRASVADAVEPATCHRSAIHTETA